MNPMNIYFPNFGIQYYPMMAYQSSYPQDQFSSISDTNGNLGHGFCSNRNDMPFSCPDSIRPTESLQSSECQLQKAPVDDINAGHLPTNTHLAKQAEPIILSFQGEISPVQPTSEIKSVSKKHQKVGKKVMMEEDRDYEPVHEKKKKKETKYQENENRNIVPNQINQIFSFIQKKNKSGALVARMLQKQSHPEQYSVKRFYLYQTLLKNKLGHYANEKCLRHLTQIYEPSCQNWTEEEQKFYMRLTRALIHHFLEEDSIFIIMTSKRMKQHKKRDHLHARRYLKECVMRALRGY